jgi:thioredoxin 1
MKAEEITWEQLHGEVLPKGGLTILDTYMTKCAPCMALMPAVQEIAEILGDKAQVCKMDVLTNRRIYHEQGLKTVPTILFFKDGVQVDRLVGGEVTKESILDKAKSLGA